MNKIPRLVIAAPASGSGKTTITCALLQSMKRHGDVPLSYKCGPDYIDPMFHARVIGVPSENLDLFFLKEGELRRQFVSSFLEKQGKIALIEGVMGLYDGLGGCLEEASTYHVAACLGAPIVLVVNARGMGRSLLPLLAGFLQYDREHLIRGVILNQTTESLYRLMKPLIEGKLPLKVLGFFPKAEELALESRHLGLKLPEEIGKLQGKLERAAELLEACVDMEELQRMAADCEGVPAAESRDAEDEAAEDRDADGRKMGGQTAGGSRTRPLPLLAVARDEVFCFYYEDNLRLLREAGLELAFFSPLHDGGLPEGACGILLGGGYPELAAKELSENTPMRQAIREAILGGMPSVAECGGFLYLQECLADGEGKTWPMAGVVPGKAKKQDRLVRFGYVEIKEKRPFFLERGQGIRGHEFHCYDCENNGADCVAGKPVTDRTWECVYEGENHWWGFPHLYYRSNPQFVKSFARAVHRWRRASETGREQEWSV